MNAKFLFGLVAVTVSVAGAAQAAPTQTKGVKVVAGAKALTTDDKASVTGMHCTCAPHDLKPGYGFGTTGHYGPPGQGFTPHDSWRMHAAGDGLTPTGRALPNPAFDNIGG
jgi:hypothetical protein